MGNSEWKTSENWFSEVSEFPENSEFSTSPWLTVLRRGCCDFVGLVHLTCWWPNHFACGSYTDTFLCHDEKDLLTHAVTQRYLWYWQLLDHVSDFSHSDSVLSCDWAKLYFRGFVIRICFNVKSQWTKKIEVFSQGASDSNNLRYETLYIGNYEYVNISSFSALGINLWLEEDDDLNRNDPLYSFKFIQSKAQNWHKMLSSFSSNLISNKQTWKFLHIFNQQ